MTEITDTPIIPDFGGTPRAASAPTAGAASGPKAKARPADFATPSSGEDRPRKICFIAGIINANRLHPY